MSYPIPIRSSTRMGTAGVTPARGPGCARVIASLLAFCLIASLMLPSSLAFAAVDARDLQIVARTLGFLDPPLTGDVTVGIVFDPGSTRSGQEAESIQKLMGDGMRVGNLVLKPVMVPLQQTATAKVHFFLLTESLGDSADQLRPVLQHRQLPCLTADLDQVRSGNCAVGIQSSPKVEILVNRQEASASNIAFASVFRMMIKEL